MAACLSIRWLKIDEIKVFDLMIEFELRIFFLLSKITRTVIITINNNNNNE